MENRVKFMIFSEIGKLHHALYYTQISYVQIKQLQYAQYNNGFPVVSLYSTMIVLYWVDFLQ